MGIEKEEIVNSIAEDTGIVKEPSVYRATLWRDAWRRLRRNKLAMFGLFIIIVLIIVAVFAPLIAPYDPDKMDFTAIKQPPSAKHLMGTDIFGRDEFSRIVHGSRVSIEVGVIAVSIMIVLGLILGAISGYFGGFLDTVIMRLADVFFAFPWVLGAIAIMTVLGPGLQNIMIAIGILGWASIARISRSSILSIKEVEYVEAARALGASHLRIIVKHILPNSMAPIIVYGTMSIGGAIITEAALSFLGLGVPPPHPAWGKMLAESLSYIYNAPWMMYFPGLAIAVTVLGFVLLADGLRDALDPRLKGMY